MSDSGPYPCYYPALLLMMMLLATADPWSVCPMVAISVESISLPYAAMVTSAASVYSSC